MYNLLIEYIYNILGKTFMLLKSFISNRRWKFGLDNEYSDDYINTFSISQDTVIGPILIRL